MLRFLANHGAGRALRHRDYALFATFGWFSTIGLWVQRVAVQWLTWELTQSYAWLGAIALVEAAAVVCIMPFAGSLADAVDRLRLARWTQILAMALAAVLAAFTIGEAINITLLVILIALIGLVEGVWMPTRMALIPNLVPRRDLAVALGVGATLFNLSLFVGPALAGVLIATLGIGYAFAVNALSYAGFLAILYFIRLRRRAAKTGATSLGHGYGQVIRHFAGQRALAVLLLLSAAASLLVRPYRELLAGYADEVFQAGAEGLATLASAGGLGAAVSAFFMANFARTRGLAGMLHLSMVASAILLIVFATTTSFTTAVVAAAGLGFALTIMGIGGQILVQITVPDAMRGRVMSLWGIHMRGGPALGAWAIGLLSATFSFSLILVAGACLFLACWVYALQHRSGLHALESRAERAPEPE